MHTGFSGWGIFLIVLVIAAVVVPSALAGRRRRRAREREQASDGEELTSFAAASGWQRANRDDLFFDGWSGAPFGIGAGRRATNVLAGVVAGRPAIAFDYSYAGSEGRANYQVCCVTLATPVGHLAVEPKSAARVTEPAASPIPIDGDFGRRYTVTGPDATLASRLLSPGLQRMLLTMPDCAWRLDGDRLVAVAPETLRAPWLRDATALLAVLVEELPSWTPPAPAR
jgi:hypothetical protein